jgi:16S rRNA (guanine527-N7)-methyltransferase
MSMVPALSPQNREKLLDALGDAQRIGMLGDRSLNEVIDHSLAFVAALPENTRTMIDLGSGGGDPGLVIAAARPEIMITLVDRRAKRTDLLTRLVGRMRFQPHVEVVEIDVALLPQRFPGRTWDAVTCRGFGSPAYTAQHASPLLAQGGLLIVSEPPESDGARWRDPEVEATGLKWQEVLHGVAILQKA